MFVRLFVFEMKNFLCLFCFFLFFLAVSAESPAYSQEQSADALPQAELPAIEHGTAPYIQPEQVPSAETSVAATAENSVSENAVYENTSNDDNWFMASAKLLGAIWKEGSWEIFAPLHAWHNREAYPKYKIDGYNEEPWGFGIGKYRMDYKNNRDGILAIGFSDSNWHFEPLLLYSWEKIWRDRRDFFRFSAGYVAGFTTRKEWHWCPLPMALPIVSLEAGPFSYSSTYIPGLGKENGNVWFSYASVRF